MAQEDVEICLEMCDCIGATDFFAKINNILYRIFAFEAEKERRPYKVKICYGRTLSERPCYILPMFFYLFYARLSWPNG